MAAPPPHPCPLAQCTNTIDGIQHQQDFNTQPTGGSGEWQEVLLPFERFQPTFRGQPAAWEPLQGGHVRQLGLMVSKFTDRGGVVPNFRSGSFRLAVKWIKGIV